MILTCITSSPQSLDSCSSQHMQNSESSLFPHPLWWHSGHLNALEGGNFPVLQSSKEVQKGPPIPSPCTFIFVISTCFTWHHWPAWNWCPLCSCGDPVYFTHLFINRANGTCLASEESAVGSYSLSRPNREHSDEDIDGFDMHVGFSRKVSVYHRNIAQLKRFDLHKVVQN